MTEDEKASVRANTREIMSRPLWEPDRQIIDARAAELLGIEGEPAPLTYEGLPLFEPEKKP